MSEPDPFTPAGRPDDTVDFTPGPEADATSPAASDATQAQSGTAPDPQATTVPKLGVPSGDGVPDAVAGYEVLGVLGRGGMGVVYKARQAGLNRLVALKMILAGEHASEGERARFIAEAQAVARIQHPNIVQVYEVGEEGGRPFFSLEYVEGGTLAGSIRGEPQPPREAARVARQLAAAVDCAHRAGVVHRDLKPANVLLTADGTPKITDFGLAKRLQEVGGQTQSGSILGTPGYMAPEQAEGRNAEVGPAADVYALGAILYEFLTGRAPFRAPTVLETLEQVRSREPVAPSDLQPGVPRDLETICLKCLQKDPRRRYDGAGALAEDLRRFLANEPILARPVGRLERGWRWCRRNPRLAALGAVTALVVLGWAGSMSALAWQLKLQQDKTDHNAAVARENERKANDSAAAARANQVQAYRNAEVAVHRMTQMVASVQKKLEDRTFSPPAEPEGRAMRDDVLKQLREEMLGLAKDLETSGATPFATLATYQGMGDVLKQLGKGEEALHQYQLGRDLAEKIARDHPDDDKSRANQALILGRVGEMELELNADGAASRECYEMARALTQDVADHPRSHDYTEVDNKRLLSGYELGLGKADFALGDSAAARGHFDASVSLRKAWSEAQPERVDARSYLSESNYWRAEACMRLGDADAARDSFDATLAICRELAANYPRDFSFRADLAEVLGARGDAWLRQGKPDEAARDYEESLANLRAALDNTHDRIDYQALLARTRERLAGAAARKGDGDGARKAYLDALKLWRALLGVEPSNLSWQAACMRTLAHCGQEAEAERKAENLRTEHPKCIPLLVDIARCHAACAAAAAEAKAKQGHVDEAVAALRAAAALGQKDAADLRSDPELAPLRDDAAYQTLLAELAKR